MAHVVNLLWYGLRDLRQSPPDLVSVGDGVRADLDVVGDRHDDDELSGHARARRLEGLRP